MKKMTSELEDDLRPEYDFSKLQVVARGAGRRNLGEATVNLAPDVAEMFPTAEAVNEALRFLIRAAKERELPRSG